MKKLIITLLVLCTAFVSHAETVRVYCRMNYSWWTDGGAAIAAYAYGDGEGAPSNAGWPGQAMTDMNDGLGTWYIDLDNIYTKIIFARVSSDGELSDWNAQTSDLDFPVDGNTLYVITSETGVWHTNLETVTGYWTTYTEGGDPTGNPTGGDTGETTLYSTSFQEWNSQTVTSMVTYNYSGIEFTVSQAKIVHNQTPSSVSGASAGYIQPYSSATLSQCYIQTGRLDYVTTVRYTHAAANAGSGWTLESSSDGVNFYAFNDYDEGCTAARQAEEKEVYVYMENVWLRWKPITTGSTSTNIYLTDITISGTSSGSAGGDPQGGNIQTYTITFYAPDACPEMKPAIMGDFNGWSSYVPMTSATSGEGRLYYSYSFQSEEGMKFRIGEQSDPENNRLQYYEDDQWINYEDYILTAETGIVLDHSNNAMYRFSQCTGGGTGGNTGNYGDYSDLLSKFGVLLNHDRYAPSEYVGVEYDHAQYRARVNLNYGDTIRMIDFSEGNVTWLPTPEEGGAYAAFSYMGDENCMICQRAGCYDVYFKQYIGESATTDQLYVAYGNECSAPSAYTGALAETAIITLQSVNDYQNTVGRVSMNGRGKNETGMVYDQHIKGTYVTIEAYPFTDYVFLRWSDGSVENPRQLLVSGDTTLNAVMGLEMEYPLGLLVNNNKFIRASERTRDDGEQDVVHAQLQSGDQFVVYNFSTGDSYLPAIEAYGMYTNFEGGTDGMPYTCKQTSCYDVYIKKSYNLDIESLYIGQGTVACSTGVDYTPASQPLNTYYLTGSFNNWSLADAFFMDGDSILLTDLAPGTYEFKVLLNNTSWDGVLGSQSINWSCTTGDISTGGDDNIMISLAEGASLRVRIVDGQICVNAVYGAVVDDYVYSVLGTSALFGTDWDYNDTRTEMTPEGDNQYKYLLDSVTLRAGIDYEYKVVTNHTVNVREWPSIEGGDNYHIIVEESGVYQVLFLLDPNTGCSATTNYLHAAAEEPQPCGALSGTCGADGNTNVTWLLCDSILTIGGEGWMADYNEETVIAPWYEYRDQIAEVYIAAGVMNTGNLAFREMNALRYVDLAGTVVSLGNYSFYNCPSLHSLTLPESVTNVGDNTPFGGSTTMTSAVYNSNVFVRLPQDYTGEYTVTPGTARIASQAFKGCSMLTSVVLPNTATILAGSSIFEECSALASVNIPEGVTTLGEFMFSGCSSLKAVDLPSTIASLGSYCFSNCWYVDSIICRAQTPPEANGSALSGINYMIPIYVPAVSLEVYPTADGWSGFTDYRAIEDIPHVCTIASGTCGEDGDNVIWQLTCDSIMYISGTGAMKTGDDEKWFDLRMSIKKVIIGDGITDLVSYAFRQAENIQEVIIGEGVTKIGNSAFWGCSGIQTLVLPSTLDTIEEQGFRSCIDIRIIDLPAGLKHLGEGAFAYCSYYDSLICRAVTPPTTDSDPFYQVPTTKPLYVPARSVALYRAADGWKNFTNILPLRDCITASGECGAEGDNVTWELTCDSVMYISGTGAMASYTTNSNGQAPWAEYGLQIQDIIIGEGVTKIGAYAFYNAGSYTNGAYNNVRSVTIPSTVGTITNNNFYQCPLLTVTLNSDSIVGKGSYSSSSSLQKIFGEQVREYIIGEEVTSIASSAFYNQSADSLRSVILPEGITSIGTWAFGYLENMDSITLPAGLQSIGSDAFYGSGLRHITIPAGVTEMGGQAFQNCDKLTSVTLQEGLTQIGTSAFANCTALPEITIPESIETIGSGAFTGCTSLTKITVLSATWVAETKSSSTTTKQALGGYVRELVLGDNITTIGKYAFTSLDSLRRISFPSSLTVIGEYAFSACKSLQNVILPNSVTTIANYAFNGCTALDSIQLSEGLLRIGTSAFYQCAGLTHLMLPESLKAISSTAFYQCTGLTGMIIPSGVDSLGSNIFGGCTNLAELTINSNDLCSQTYSPSTNIKSAFNQDAIKTYIIGEGVTQIGKYAFYNAPMTALVLPSTLTSVNQGSFGSCTSLTRVTCNALTPPTLQNNSFSKQDTLIVPCEAKASYRAAQYWSSFSPIMCDGQQDMTFNLTSAWTFLMLPTAFSMSADDIIVDGAVEWGTYNGSLRAMGRSGWENYDAAAVHMCSQALIVRAANGTATLTFTVPQQAVNKTETMVSLSKHTALHEQNANWNFLGNPYPYTYDIMSALAAQGLEAPVTVWNGTAYQMYTPGIDTYVLQPFEAFFIQLPDDGAESLTLSPEYIED